MRITLSFLFFCILFSSASNSYSQKFTIKSKTASIKEVCKEIEKGSDYVFIFSDNCEKLIDKKVNVEANSKNVTEVLDAVLSRTGLTYKILDKQIVVYKSTESAPSVAVEQPDINIIQQPAKKQITGKVVDAQGEAIIGANIIETRTTNGTVTDVNGNFSLDVENNATIRVSYIGYLEQSIATAGQSAFNITLQEDTQALDEVVVIGYGVQKKVNLTGSVASVGSVELTKRPTPNVQNLLQGKVSGLQINQRGGTPGADAGTMRIRGVGTFSSAGSNPLILIDGIQGDISTIDPNNIESISVLKDAASAAIYGARAANGVILITTKTGKIQDVSVEYHVSLEAHKATRLPDILTNSADYMELWNEANKRSGKSQYFTQEEINAFRNNPDDPVNYPNFNWVDYIFKTAFVHNHHLGISGGNEKTSFNLALGYLDQGGIVDLYDFKRYNLLLSVDTKVTDWFTLGGNIQGMRRDITQDVQGAHNEAYFVMHAFGPGPNYTPTMTLPDGSTGYVARYSSSIAEWTVRNPASIIAQGSNVTNNYNVRPQIYANVKLTNNLNWQTKGAFNFNYNFQKNHEHAVSNYYFKDGSYAHDGAVWNLGVRDNIWTSNLTTLYSTLDYNNTFNSIHNLGVLVGYNQESYLYRTLAGSRMYFPTDNLKELNAGSSLNQSTSGTASEWAIQSLFGRITYDYKNKYLFEANARYDGTSRIAPDTRWGFFPSASAAWRISEESFMKETSWLDDLKFRASWGKLGNQNVGTYPYQDVLSTTSYAFDDLESGVRLTRLVDKKLKWETTTITDFGLDLNIKNGLFSLTADWYNKFTDGILYGIPVPASIGLSAPTVNGGQMKNTGWDFELGHRNNVGKVRYNASLNFSTYKNEVVKIISPSYGTTTVQEGLPYGSYYLIEWDGIFQNQQEIDNSPRHPFGPKPGDLKYKDQLTVDTNNDGVPDAGDGVINAEDRVVVDGAYPKFYYGGSIDVFWKNFDISVFFQGIEGIKNYLGGTHAGWGFTPYTQGSPPTKDFVKNRWTGEGSTNKYPAIFESTYQPIMGTASTYWLHDASYFRLKNLRIGYNIPQHISGKIGLKNAQVYFSGDNLFTITSYPGADPERSGLTTQYSVYPQLTTYAFGIKIKL